MKNNAIIRADLVVSELHVWLNEDLFPFPKMKVKILKRDHDYVALPNLHVLDLQTRSPDYISGIGSDEDEAFCDLIERFVDLAKNNSPPEGLNEEDFEWSSPDDF